MSDYQLLEEIYLLPTAAGAFYAVSDQKEEPLRNLLITLLYHKESLLLSTDKLCNWLGIEEEQKALELLYRAQTMSWVQGSREPAKVPGLALDKELPEMLTKLSSVGKALLVDENGFYVAHSNSMDDETAGVLGALSGDLAALQARHEERLKQYLNLSTQGWAAVDGYGASRLGAWPLYVGSKRFMLVIIGEPRLNRNEFITMIWILINRHGSSEVKEEDLLAMTSAENKIT